MANAFMFSKDKFVWVDEIGSNCKDMLRKYGYPFSSERAVCRQLAVRGQCISSIAAICTETTTESVNVTGFAKRGLIGASDFTTLKKHNLICSNAINFRFCHNVV